MNATRPRNSQATKRRLKLRRGRVEMMKARSSSGDLMRFTARYWLIAAFPSACAACTVPRCSPYNNAGATIRTTKIAGMPRINAQAVRGSTHGDDDMSSRDTVVKIPGRGRRFGRRSIRGAPGLGGGPVVRPSATPAPWPSPLEYYNALSSNRGGLARFLRTANPSAQRASRRASTIKAEQWGSA